MGKSALALAVAINVAKAGHGVLYVSLEISLKMRVARFASLATYTSGPRPEAIAYNRALNGQLNDSERERFCRAGMRWAMLPIAVEERPSLSMLEIAARTRKTAQEFDSKGQRLGLVVVDLLGKVKPSDLRAPLVQQFGQVSNDLTALAKSEDVAVLALHQLNRGAEDRESKIPQLADLRGSGHLEQDADNVWLLYRPAYYPQRGKDDDTKNALEWKAQQEKERCLLKIILAKNRNGERVTVDTYCDLAFNAITDLDRRQS